MNLFQFLNSQLFKYLVVGSLGTFLDIGFLYLFFDILGINLYLAVTLSFTIAFLNNFFLNKSWTFQSRSRNYRKLMTKFFIVSMIGLILSIGLMFVMVDLIGIWHILAKILTSGVVVVWNFLANKFWTFRIKDIPQDFPEPKVALSVIVPAYNEENRIVKTLNEISKFLSNNSEVSSYEILVIDDGSTDQTKEIVSKMIEEIPCLRLVSYKRNQGKGYAFKTGVLEASGEYILLTDADLSTPIDEYNNLKKHVEGYPIVIGSRYMKDSDVRKSQPKYRIFISRIANKFIQLFLITGILDTQCGFKLFEAKLIKTICHLQKINRFGFDMEILLIADNMDKKIKEVPVVWVDADGSKVRPVRDAIRTLKELTFIKLNLLSGRYNDYK